MVDRTCSFCHQKIDVLEKVTYSQDKLQFHSFCRTRANDPIKTLEEIKELLVNLEKWQQEHPDWKYQPE